MEKTDLFMPPSKNLEGCILSANIKKSHFTLM